MGVSQSKTPMVASAPPTPHPSATRTSSGVAVVPDKSRVLGCFPRKPVGPATRATRASSVESSEGGGRPPRHSTADVSQLIAELKGASPSQMRDTRARLCLSLLSRTAVTPPRTD